MKRLILSFVLLLTGCHAAQTAQNAATATAYTASAEPCVKAALEAVKAGQPDAKVWGDFHTCVAPVDAAYGRKP